MGLQTTNQETDSVPTTLLGVRRGLAGSVDAGLLITESLSIQADLNIELYESDDLTISFNPAISHHFIIEDLETTFVWLPILADVYSSELLTLTVIGRWGRAQLHGLDDEVLGIAISTDFVSIGIGGRWRVSPGWTLLPEFHAMQPTANELDGLTIYSFSLGFLF